MTQTQYIYASAALLLATMWIACWAWGKVEDDWRATPTMLTVTMACAYAVYLLARGLEQ